MNLESEQMVEKRNLYRNIRIEIRVTAKEKEKLLANSAKAGITKYTNYIRKMGLHGFVLNKDFSELKNLAGSLGAIGYEFNQIGNNINQIAKKVNESEIIDRQDFENLQSEFKSFKAEFRKMEREIFTDIEKRLDELEEY